MKKSIIVSICLVLSLLISGCGESDKGNKDKTSNTSEEKVTPSSATQLAEYYLEQADSKTNKKGLAFAKKNHNIFIEHQEQELVALDEPKLKKSPESIGESFVSISGYVLEANEEEYEEQPVTILQVAYDNTESVYQVIYDGSIEIYEEDYIVAHGLVAGIIRDENLSGTLDDFPILISNYIAKQ